MTEETAYAWMFFKRNNFRNEKEGRIATIIHINGLCSTNKGESSDHDTATHKMICLLLENQIFSYKTEKRASK